MSNFILTVNPTLTLVRVPSAPPAFFSLASAADLTEVHPEMLRYYCRVGLLGARRTEPGIELLFDVATLHEVRRLEHYRRHLGVHRRALPLLCELRRAAERLKVELRFLEV